MTSWKEQDRQDEKVKEKEIKMLTLLVQEIHEELKQQQNELEAERKQNYERVVRTAMR